TDSSLSGEVSVEIFGGVEGIVGFGDVVGENGGVELGFFPFAELQGFGELCVVDADLPREKTSGFGLGFSVFAYSGLVDAGQRRVWEAAVAIEIDIVVVFFFQRGRCDVGWVGDVKDEKSAIRVEERPDVTG